MLVSKMRMNNLKYWLIPFYPHFWEMWQQTGELFFKFSNNAKDHKNDGFQEML